MIDKLLHKIKRKLIKTRLQPIRVFCFHQVSDTFDESTMKQCDWLQTDVFKRIIYNILQKRYEFISLTEAHQKLQYDIIRCKKYAVLTADDGWASIKNILPWLNEEQIPITLFLNPAYLDGKHFRERETEQYLTEEEVQNLYKQYPLVTIGLHGWEHKDATKQTEGDFRESVEKSERYMKESPNYIPYFAYTWGRCTSYSQRILAKRGIIPLFISGKMNVDNKLYIDREMLEENMKIF